MIRSGTVSRRPVSPVALLPALALVGGLACAGAEGRGAPPAKATEGGTAGDEKGAAKMHVVRNETAVEVEVGEGIDLVVTRPVAIPSELQYEWPSSPSIEGEAVRFVRLRVEQPPPEVDGGVTRHHYELEAVKPGTARVVLVPRPAGPTAVQAPRELSVTVRAASRP